MLIKVFSGMRIFLDGKNGAFLCRWLLLEYAEFFSGLWMGRVFEFPPGLVSGSVGLRFATWDAANLRSTASGEVRMKYPWSILIQNHFLSHAINCHGLSRSLAGVLNSGFSNYCRKLQEITCNGKGSKHMPRSEPLTSPRESDCA